MKIYQAVSEQICVKDFADSIPDGWFASAKEALAAFVPEVTETPEGEAKPKRKWTRRAKVEQ